MNSSTGSTALYKIICHNPAGSYPPTPADITTGARTETTGGLSFNAQGPFYLYGITLIGQGLDFMTLSPVANPSWTYFDRCSLQLNTANTAISLTGNGGDMSNAIFNNTTVKFINTGCNVELGNTHFIWQNTGPVLEAGSAIPTQLVSLGYNIGGAPNTAVFQRLDLSQINTKVAAAYGDGARGTIGVTTIQDCITTGAATYPIRGEGQSTQLVRTSSDGTAYKTARYSFAGSETTETTIYRSGGSLDPNGRPTSRKIQTNPYAEWIRPTRRSRMQCGATL